MVKRFLEWIRVKERIDTNAIKPILFKEGEVWWCAFGENVGNEMNGKGTGFARPVYVLKKYDKYSFLGLPITTKEKVGSWYVPITLRGGPRVVVLSQGRTLDYRRLDKRVGEINSQDKERIMLAYGALHIKSIRAIAGAGRG